MSRILRIQLGLLLATGLAACTGNAVDVPYVGTFNPMTLHYMAGKGAVYTRILGNPFTAPREEVERAVTTTMYGAHPGPDLRFSTLRDPDNTSPYSVIVMFDPAPSLSPAALCKDPGRSAAATTENAGTAIRTGTIRVMLALCAAGYRETSVTGRVSGVSGPRDAAFKALIRQMTGQLFPRRNPNINNGADDFDI